MTRWRQGWNTLARSLFVLTRGERQALCLIMALALLGLGVKTWQARQASHGGVQPLLTQPAR